ncbi:MAG: hypothetical protein KGY80_08825 [Candidatus Thorarchaeota archaeon]|nr:hypothetical protein [Candidatus Thorarchaeota archaeon]
MVHSDLKEALGQLCSDFRIEDIKTNEELPREINQSLESLVSVVDGVKKLPASILGVDLPAVEYQEYQTYG